MSNNQTAQTAVLESYLEKLNILQQLLNSTKNLDEKFDLNMIYPQNYPNYEEFMSNRTNLINADGEGRVHEKVQGGINVQIQPGSSIMINNIQENISGNKITVNLQNPENVINNDEHEEGYKIEEKIKESQISSQEPQNEPLDSQILSQKRKRCEEDDRDNSQDSLLRRSSLVSDNQNSNLKQIYKCMHENCESTFSFLENLVKHEKMHDQKEYRCENPGCGKSFSVLFNFQRHVKCHRMYRESKANITASSKQIDKDPNKNFISRDSERKMETGNLSNNLSNTDIIKTNEVSSNFKLKKSSRSLKCRHPKCELTFKTQKLKTLHHNNLDTECFEEKNDLLKTLSNFVKFIKKYKKYKIYQQKDTNKEDQEEFRNLWRTYENFHKSYKNKELLLSVVGEFEDLSK